MSTEPIVTMIDKGALLETASRAKADCFNSIRTSIGACCRPREACLARLVQISATALSAGCEINYSFARDYELITFRVTVGQGEGVYSVSGIFASAFLYENEMHDLFGIPVENMSVNYKGMFYKLAQRTPYGFPSGPGKAGA